MVFVLLLAAAGAWGQGADEQYVRIYGLIQEADALNDGGQPRQAMARYQEAQAALSRFPKSFPGWNENVVRFRLNYVTAKLAPLLTQFPTATNAPVIPVPPTPATTTNLPAEASAKPPQPVPPPPVIPDLREVVQRLEAENAGLSAKLKEALSAQPAALDPKELTKAQEKNRELQKENDLLKVSLEQEQAKAAKLTDPAAVTAANLALAEAKKKLDSEERTRAALQAENEVLKKQGSKRGSSKGSPADGQQELAALQARVQVLEAKPSPYSAEELAALSKPDVKMVAVATQASPAGTNTPATASKDPQPAAAKKTAKELPPGAGALAAAAQRDFTDRRFAEAEKKYLEILRQDDKNVYTLGNVAAIQVEMNKLDDAEKNLDTALGVDPQDDFCLYLMGRVKFLRGKQDEALNYLSRAAKVNPDNPETQNYLGIVLSEKGQRIPAEAAFRKAIQLQPGYGAAHNNLAFVYATQKPPSLALARWHYQKALAAGHARNPELEKLLGESK
jgi:tetratricopeptide (TPR) repeat protein